MKSQKRPHNIFCWFSFWIKGKLPEQSIHFADEEFIEFFIHVVIESHFEPVEGDDEILFVIDCDDIKDMEFLNIVEVHVDGHVDIYCIELLLFFEMGFDLAFHFHMFGRVGVIFHA